LKVFETILGDGDLSIGKGIDMIARQRRAQYCRILQEKLFDRRVDELNFSVPGLPGDVCAVDKMETVFDQTNRLVYASRLVP